MIEILAQITSDAKPRFTAGIVLWDDKVIEVAPIVKYMKKWSRAQVRDYCARRGWKISIVHQVERRDTRYVPGSPRGKAGVS
jgi:hypothetical protein